MNFNTEANTKTEQYSYDDLFKDNDDTFFKVEDVRVRGVALSDSPRLLGIPGRRKAKLRHPYVYYYIVKFIHNKTPKELDLRLE